MKPTPVQVRVVRDDGTTYFLPAAEISFSRPEVAEDPTPFKRREARFTATVEMKALNTETIAMMLGVPLSLIEPDDRRLATSPVLRGIPGTAAYGAALGRRLRVGRVWSPTTDRELRFTLDMLERRGLKGYPLSGSLYAVSVRHPERSLHWPRPAADMGGLNAFRRRYEVVSTPRRAEPPYAWSSNS